MVIFLALSPYLVVATLDSPVSQGLSLVPVPAVLDDDPDILGGPGIAATVTVKDKAEDPFMLSSQFAYEPRKIKVFTISAGFSGLMLAHKFRHRDPELRNVVSHTIFEARSDVGGT